MSTSLPALEASPDHLGEGSNEAQVKVSKRSGRRSTRACQRCREKKLKCQVTHSRTRCVACIKTRTDCVFDETPDGVPRGAEYVAALEARVLSLEKELLSSDTRSSLARDGLDEDDVDHSIASNSSSRIDAAKSGNTGREDRTVRPANLPEYSFNEFLQHNLQGQDPLSDGVSDNAKFNILQSGPSTSEIPVNVLPPVPDDRIANQLLEKAYFYTQARYCIVDWAKVREWHSHRTRICFASKKDNTDEQIGAYFLWIVYAIGAGLIQNPPHPSKAYFSRARTYIPTILASQDLTTVQGLLCLLQYVFRVSGGPSAFHIIGITVRLCIELDCHRKASKKERGQDPLTIELRKRFFWCAYCFDRIISSMTRRPFGISDNDIDAEVPVNIDVISTDVDKIKQLQVQQATGVQSYQEATTTMSAALRHLQMYRLKSQFITRFVGPHAPPPTYEDIRGCLEAIDNWKVEAIREYPAHIPHQPEEFVRAMYFHTLLFIIRPALMQRPIDPDLLRRCAEESAAACRNARALNLDSHSAPSLVGLYQTFLSGVSLLLSLAIQPTVVPTRQALRAIIACSDTLAVYTRLYAGVATFRELFEKLSDLFLGDAADSQNEISGQTESVRLFLEEILFSAPADTPELLRSFSQKVSQVAETDLLSHSDNLFRPDFPLLEDFNTFLEFGDLVLPFETTGDLFHPIASP